LKKISFATNDAKNRLEIDLMKNFLKIFEFYWLLEKISKK
jgi:hypothetical protein